MASLPRDARFDADQPPPLPEWAPRPRLPALPPVVLRLLVALLFLAALVAALKLLAPAPTLRPPAPASAQPAATASLIILTLDPAAFPGTYATRALAACADRDRCAVIGAFPAATSGQTPAFLYVRDRRTGAEGAWWDCTALPRANPARCLPKGTALARLLAEWG